MKYNVYYSESLKSWVRLERQEDGEYCHTSGFSTEEEAKYKVPLFSNNPPEWLENSIDNHK